jgi:hypothetical protein
MEIKVADEIRANSNLESRVSLASKVVGEMFASVEQPPTVTWRLSELVRTSPRVELELLDDGDFVARDFTFDQLADTRQFRSALPALWGDLIMLAYGRSTKRLHDALREIRKEEERRELQPQGT